MIAAKLTKHFSGWWLAYMKYAKSHKKFCSNWGRKRNLQHLKSQENININPNINPDHQNCHVIRWKSTKIYDWQWVYQMFTLSMWCFPVKLFSKNVRYTNCKEEFHSDFSLNFSTCRLQTADLTNLAWENMLRCHNWLPLEMMPEERLQKSNTDKAVL